MSTQPIIPDALRALLAQNVGPRVVGPQDTPPPPVPINTMPQTMTPLPVPTAPRVVGPAPAVAATTARTLLDQNELRRLDTSGSGIHQITNPVDASGNPTGQPVSGLRRFGGVLARIGDVAESIVSPRAAQMTPGTDLHHQMLLNQSTGQVNNDLANQHEQAGTTLLDAQPELKQLAAENAFMKTQGLLGHYQDQANHWDNQTDQQLAAHGYKRDPQGNIAPMSYQELPPQMQALDDLSTSRKELADASTAYTDAKKKNLPLQMQMAAQRIQTAQQNMGLSAAKLGLRQQEDSANFLGTYNGQPIGTTDANGNPQGLRVTTANNPTTMRLRQSDLAHNVIQNANQIGQIIDQNPNLFGSVQGRFTSVQQMIGSDNPAIAQLGVEFHNIALASNGAHGLRSQEAVIATENELLNHYRNGPQATKAALKAMTDSVQTFIDAADRGKKTLPDPGSPSGNRNSQPKDGDVKTNSAGDQIIYRGGKWSLK